MKKLAFIFAFIVLSVSASAQELLEEKPADAFATWTDIIIRKDFDKWHVGGLVEYCTINKGQGMTHNEAVIRPIVGYNPLPWLRFQGQIDFLYSWYTGFYLRYLADVTLHWKAGDFRFSFRTRGQFSHKVSTGKVSPTIRNRFKVDYLIPDSPVSLHMAAEPYWLKSFVKTRYYLGADFKVNKNLSITTDYVRYQHYEPTTPHQNVVYLTLYVRL